MNRFVTFSALVIVTGLLFTGCSPAAKKEALLDRAAAFVRSGDFEKAEIECLNVLKLDRENVRALEYLGTIWLERGAPLRAAPLLAAVRSRAPANREVRRQLMQINLTIGKLAEAKKEALGILQRLPDDKEAIIALSRAARTKQDLEGLEQALNKGNRGSAAYHIASANLLMRRGDAKGAAAALQRAQSLEPQAAQVRMAQAAYQLWLNNPEGAGAAFKAAAELSPARSLEKIRYAEFLTQTGALPQAETLLREITTKAPDYLPAWRGLAYIAMAGKKFDEARAHLKTIFARDPGNYEGRIAEARLLLAQEQTAQAISSLTETGKQFPAVAEDKFLLGQAHLQNGDPERARLALRSAVTQNPDYQDAILLLARLNLAAGDVGPVAEAMGELLANQPNLVPAQMLYLEAMRAMGRLDEAAQSIRLQIKASPERVELHRLLGLVLIRLQKTEEARKSLEQSLQLTPGFVPIVAELVALDLKDKDFAGAMKRVQAEMKRTPLPAPSVRFLEARVLVAEGRWDEAEDILLQVLEQDPQMTGVYELLSQGFVGRGPSAQNLSRIAEFLAKRPDDIQAALTAGQALTQLKQPAKARDVYEGFLGKRPDSPAVLNNLAVLYAEQLDNSTRALELARKARQLAPLSPEIADTLGWILYGRKEYTEAQGLFREGAVRAPRNGEILFHLGLASQQLGQNEIARAAFERASRLPGDFPGKDQIARRLADLPTPPAGSVPPPPVDRKAK
ncbi:MAG: tetratricopeptide repeat protein [Opitutaceae bacterium]|nr:tetratricopeptide repeat protein [Opitutaceae bacterium]